MTYLCAKGVEKKLEKDTQAKACGYKTLEQTETPRQASSASS
jgi:TATA-binding protein-associated factor Taf7